jgi:hypothetical protein
MDFSSQPDLGAFSTAPQQIFILSDILLHSLLYFKVLSTFYFIQPLQHHYQEIKFN